jgi:hypothetical protein
MMLDLPLKRRSTGDIHPADEFIFGLCNMVEAFQ